MQHFIATIAPAAQAEDDFCWSASDETYGQDIDGLVDKVATALETGAVTLGVSVFDEMAATSAIHDAAKGMKLVQLGSPVLASVLEGVRSKVDFQLYLGQDQFNSDPGQLLLWQVQRTLSAPSVAYDTRLWADKAFGQIRQGLSQGALSNWREKSLPICVVGGALYRCNWSEWVDYSEDMMVLEI